MKHLLTVSEAIARSAIERKESRGGHFRDDYPKKDEAFSTFNVVTYRQSDGQMGLRRQPIAPMPQELKDIIQQEST